MNSKLSWPVTMGGGGGAFWDPFQLVHTRLKSFLHIHFHKKKEEEEEEMEEHQHQDEKVFAYPFPGGGAA